MREIKFRVFINGECWYGEPWLSPKAQIIVEREKLLLMQFTGIKDKHGSDIYEGDIVTYITSYGNRMWNKTVAWRTGPAHCGWNIAQGRKGSRLEVIGNIHEHAHLLKEKKE